MFKDKIEKLIAWYKAANEKYEKLFQFLHIAMGGGLVAMLFILGVQLVNGAYFILIKHWEVIITIILVGALIIHKIYIISTKEEKPSIPNVARLDYTYTIFGKHLFQIVKKIASAFAIVSPKFPSDLTAPVRWTFLGKTAVFHYLAQIIDEVDTELLKRTLQSHISNRLDTGKIDGTESSSKIYGSMAYPRIMVHNVEVTSNLVEISIVFTTEDYVEFLQNSFVSSVDDALDIRYLEDDEV